MDWITTSTMLDDLRDYENQDAWRVFVHRFHRPVVAFVRKLGMDDATAEDVAQEALVDFAEAFRRGEYDRSKGRLSRWLFGIVYRRALRERRSASRRESVVADRTDATRWLGAVPDEATATGIWDDAWQHAILAQCLEQVQREVEPTTFRAFELVVRHDRRAADVAAELGIAVTAVYNAKHRVTRRIRELREADQELR